MTPKPSEPPPRLAPRVPLAFVPGPVPIVGTGQVAHLTPNGWRVVTPVIDWSTVLPSMVD